VYFEVVGEIEQIETIAVGGRIRDNVRLRQQYGEGRWRKLKGIAMVRLKSGELRRAELHWYDLERRKIYRLIPDEEAAKEGYLRVVDESGEDYLYPESYFVIVKLPIEVQEVLASTS
jgi:hypothetical protein